MQKTSGPKRNNLMALETRKLREKKRKEKNKFPIEQFLSSSFTDACVGMENKASLAPAWAFSRQSDGFFPLVFFNKRPPKKEPPPSRAMENRNVLFFFLEVSCAASHCEHPYHCIICESLNWHWGISCWLTQPKTFGDWRKKKELGAGGVVITVSAPPFLANPGPISLPSLLAWFTSQNVRRRPRALSRML